MTLKQTSLQDLMNWINKWKKKKSATKPCDIRQHHRLYFKYLINDGKEDWYTSLVNFSDASKLDEIEIYECLLDLHELHDHIQSIPNDAAPDIGAFKSHVECRINIALSHYMRFIK